MNRSRVATGSAAVLVAASMLMSAAGAQTAPTPVDTGVFAYSTTPIPGGATIGRWEISNHGTTALPAGTTYLVEFSSMTGGKQRSLSTVSTLNLRYSKVVRLAPNKYRITLTRDLGAGAGLQGLWSESHGFRFAERSKVTISLENLPGTVTDTKTSNDVWIYDNHGLGF